MARVVDKDSKRREVASACNDLLLEKGIKNLTVAEVAKTAGIGKGTVYEYFENKEDIVFEIIRSHILDYQEELNTKFNPNNTTKEKIFHLFDFILNENEVFKKHQNIYKEYLSINLGVNNDGMCKFNNECSSFFRAELEKIILEGIKKGELIESSTNFIEGLLALEKGFLLISWTEDKDVKEDFSNFLNGLFNLIEKK